MKKLTGILLSGCLACAGSAAAQTNVPPPPSPTIQIPPPAYSNGNSGPTPAVSEPAETATADEPAKILAPMPLPISDATPASPTPTTIRLLEEPARTTVQSTGVVADCPCQSHNNPGLNAGYELTGSAPYWQTNGHVQLPSLEPPITDGLQVRHPYYSYRRPWYTPGQASLNVTIVW